jgi:hypothetical protein
MARKTLVYTIADDGRDKGKRFLITEMGATQSFKWAVKVFFALANAGIELPEGIEESGPAGIAVMGFKAIGKIPVDTAQPLLDELLDCVQIKEDVATRSITDDDIEEIMTRVILLKEVFGLHVNFSALGNLSSSRGSEAGMNTKA